jgi:uncharacterized protein (TIGR02145 family)
MMTKYLLSIGFIFLTLLSNAQLVTDIDGNNYSTVIIGSQVWMVENLKSIKYCNGDTISSTIPAAFNISNESTPKYQWAYDGIDSNANTYGRLYTWYTVTDIRNICPTGWHVPSIDEWTVLSDYLTNNGYGYEGSGYDIAKSLASSSGWIIADYPGNVGNDQASNNSSGFTALPGGSRYDYGSFVGIGDECYWWSSTEDTANYAWIRHLESYWMNFTYGSFPKNFGHSVRCIEDNIPSSNNSINRDEMIIYPNPAKEKLYLKNINQTNALIMIYDLQGKLVLCKQIDTYFIDISNLRKGIYVLKMTGSRNVLINKFIKE